jgi:hypothetical protein
MDASPGPAARPPAAGAFVDRLRCLTDADFAALVRRVDEFRATPADEVERCKATAAVAVELRRRHRSRGAAIASLRAGEAVLAAPGANGIAHDRVVGVARAAEDVACSLVAGGPSSALGVLGRGWEDLVAAESSPSQPTA